MHTRERGLRNGWHRWRSSRIRGWIATRFKPQCLRAPLLLTNEAGKKNSKSMLRAQQAMGGRERDIASVFKAGRVGLATPLGLSAARPQRVEDWDG